MRDLVILFALLLLYLPLTVVLNRLQLALSPRKRTLPAQGTIFSSALAALLACLVPGALLLGGSAGERLLWAAYLAILLGCALLLYGSAMCVSESGRRFYLMNLIDRRKGLRLEQLRAAYGREHMLAVRLQRLCAWKVLEKRQERYYLVKPSAYLASSFFHWWGRILGFRWF